MWIYILCSIKGEKGLDEVKGNLITMEKNRRKRKGWKDIITQWYIINIISAPFKLKSALMCSLILYWWRTNWLSTIEWLKPNLSITHCSCFSIHSPFIKVFSLLSINLNINRSFLTDQSDWEALENWIFHKAQNLKQVQSLEQFIRSSTLFFQCTWFMITTEDLSMSMNI